MSLVSITLVIYLMDAHENQNSHEKLEDHNLSATKWFLFIKKYVMSN